TILLTFLVTVFWGMCCGSAVTMAQDAEAAQAETQPADAVVTESDSATPPQAGPASAQDRIVYIPFKDLDGTFQDANSNVILPYAEYQEMLKAWKSRTEIAAPPAAVMTSA